jgi:hypothetical protein
MTPTCSGMSRQDVSNAAFTWAAFGAAESLLHGLARNPNNGQQCARYLLDFVIEGGIALPPRHFIDKTVDLYPWLAPQQERALRLLTTLQNDRDQHA